MLGDVCAVGRAVKIERDGIMLKGIPSRIESRTSGHLLPNGYGDEIVLVDAHFPGETMNGRVVRADGVGIPQLLAGFLPLFELNAYGDGPVVMMAAVPENELDPQVEARYRVELDRHWKPGTPVARMDRFAFYDCVRDVFAVVITGETAKYGKIILKKGVTP
jgi:L-fucose mutarotase